MNTKQLTDLLNAKIEIKEEAVKPMTAEEYNKTMDNFALKLNDMFKTLDQNKTKETQQGETTDNDNKQ